MCVRALFQQNFPQLLSLFPSKIDTCLNLNQIYNLLILFEKDLVLFHYVKIAIHFVERYCILLGLFTDYFQLNTPNHTTFFRYIVLL